MDERYSPRDRERFLPEEHSSRRSDFARDRARLVHSSALRRLSLKTQVMSPSSGLDFSRNRLTNSREVAQVGREVADSLGLSADVVDTACLAHDLGHPPFGHNGERALDEWAGDIGGFEGNAQTLRIVTRLEPKVLGPDGEALGLNLTRASLDAIAKYPWPARPGRTGERGKYSVYDDDLAVFAWMREDAPDRVPCIEAQTMDLADDIAYSVHDFEDAVVNGYVSLASLARGTRRDELIATMADWSGQRFEHDELSEALDRLQDMPRFMHGWDASRRDQARLKNLTSDLIGRFAKAAIAATLEAADGAALSRFAGSILVPRPVRAEIAVLKGIVAANIMTSDRRAPLYRQQRLVLQDLADALWRTGAEHLEPAFAADFEAAADDAARTRVIVDQVASLTDQGAIAWAERVVGESAFVWPQGQVGATLF